MNLRIRVRTLIALVAVSALALGVGYTWGVRVERFRTIAQQHRGLEGFYRVQTKTEQGRLEVNGPEYGERYSDKIRRLIASYATVADYHAGMRRKYERLAARPWLPMSP